MSLLEVEGLHAGYGPVRVLQGLDFSVEEGQKVEFEVSPGRKGDEATGVRVIG